jgi:hypothetical protein
VSSFPTFFLLLWVGIRAGKFSLAVYESATIDQDTFFFLALSRLYV